LIKFEMAKLTLESGDILVARVSGELSADFVSQVQYRRLAAQHVGRPFAASEAQAARVRKLHKQGMSLRGIVDQLRLADGPHHRGSGRRP
jgi:hypothetical protein